MTTQTQETTTITMPVYRTPNGAPTCCANVNDGRICPLLRARRMGLEFHCALSALTLEDGAEGYLVPLPDCLIHREKP